MVLITAKSLHCYSILFLVLIFRNNDGYLCIGDTTETDIRMLLPLPIHHNIICYYCIMITKHISNLENEVEIMSKRFPISSTLKLWVIEHQYYGHWWLGTMIIDRNDALIRYKQMSGCSPTLVQEICISSLSMWWERLSNLWTEVSNNKHYQNMCVCIFSTLVGNIWRVVIPRGSCSCLKQLWNHNY